MAPGAAASTFGSRSLTCFTHALGSLVALAKLLLSWNERSRAHQELELLPENFSVAATVVPDAAVLAELPPPPQAATSAALTVSADIEISSRRMASPFRGQRCLLSAPHRSEASSG